VWWYLTELPQGRKAARAGELFQVRGGSFYTLTVDVSTADYIEHVSIALYRRYRPESFADVIGQDHVTQPLMQALRTGRVSHAYLFSGPRGCGKTTSARILARCLNCEQGPTPIPCGVCESCVSLARDGSGSVDVIEIDAASHGGVDDARDLRERAAYGPALSRYKIYIIDEAHMVTPQGFNALLKIVEEPPEHVKFIFATTQPDKVIGTIRSRTHHYPFRLVPPLRLQQYLGELCTAEGVSVAPGVLSFVVRAGGGSVRDSLSVLDQLISGSGQEGLTYQGAAALLGFTEAELLDATIDGLAAGDAGAVFRQIDKVIETGQDPRRFVEDVLERLRDLIVVAAVPDGASSILRGTPEDQLERIRQQSAAFGPGALSRSADIVNAGLTEMTGATAPRLQLELICARVLLPGASGENGFAARLDRLERRLEINGGAAPAGSRPSASVPPAAGEPPITESAKTDPPADNTSAGAAPTTELSSGASLAVIPVPPAVRKVAPAPGGIDTDAIRRSWPDILAKIFTIRRTTWTFLSEHTQVLDYDGKRLLLGIQTEGLATTFRRGQHAELVRQALSEVLGVEAVVEGIPTAKPVRSTSGVPVVSSPEQTTTASPASSPPAAPEVRSTPMQRARAAVAHEASTQNTSASSAVADSMVSADDEDIDEGVAVGQPVIARVLGGTVIAELDQ
jgi:DNA polymerase-3 subunit gamma/tau